MQDVNKWVQVLIVAVILVALTLFVSMFLPKTAGATSLHTAWQDKGDVKWGECQTEVKAACGNIEGTQYGEQKQECKLLSGGGGFACILGQKRTIEVSQSCVVEGPVCEEPTCEELQNCPVPEVPPVVKDTPDRAKFAVSQGPNGVLGDGKVQIEWKKFDGSKRVEIAVAKDCVFGNGYWSAKTGDDGAYNLLLDGPSCVKVRGFDDKTEWSKVKHVNP